MPGRFRGCATTVGGSTDRIGSWRTRCRRCAGCRRRLGCTGCCWRTGCRWRLWRICRRRRWTFGGGRGRRHRRGRGRNGRRRRRRTFGGGRGRRHRRGRGRNGRWRRSRSDVRCLRQINRCIFQHFAYIEGLHGHQRRTRWRVCQGEGDRLRTGRSAIGEANHERAARRPLRRSIGQRRRFSRERCICAKAVNRACCHFGEWNAGRQRQQDTAACGNRLCRQREGVFAEITGQSRRRQQRSGGHGRMPDAYGIGAAADGVPHAEGSAFLDDERRPHIVG